MFLIHLNEPAGNWQSLGWGDGQAGSSRDTGMWSQGTKMPLHQQLSEELPKISSPQIRAPQPSPLECPTRTKQGRSIRFII